MDITLPPLPHNIHHPCTEAQCNYYILVYRAPELSAALRVGIVILQATVHSLNELIMKKTTNKQTLLNKSLSSH